MIVNKLWIFLIVAGIVYSFITHNVYLVNLNILESPKEALNIMMILFPNIVLWSGLLQVAKDNGYLEFISRKMMFITHFLFPEVPKDNQAHYYISANMCSNLLGLGSAAIPMGIKAMNCLQELNSNKRVATCSMITLILINTSSLTLIPTSILVLRNSYDSVFAFKIIPLIMLNTIITTTLAITLDKIVRKVYA